MTHLSVFDFRNHTELALDLRPGPVVLHGGNGTGKTSLLEALAWCSTLSSHRAASTATLVRAGAEAGHVRCRIVSEGRETWLETSLVRSGRARARRNGTDLARPRDLLGTLRTVLFAPEDLAVVRGDPAGRRDLLDDLLVQLAPRVHGLRVDLDRVVRQRTALLRTWRDPSGADAAAHDTLAVWDDQLVRLGTELALLRLRLLDDLRPLVRQAHDAVAGHGDVEMRYASRWLPLELAGPAGEGPDGAPEPAQVAAALREGLDSRAREERARGLTLVGPQRDDVDIELRGLPARTHSSHGEAWSVALALRLATAALLRAQGDDPVVLLDDVFAELDGRRRLRLAEVCARFEQVLATAAVLDDVPQVLQGQVVEIGES